jgi:uncharacterized membrane protein YedE/YeeE
MELIPDRVAWYIVGPLMGLLVAGLFAVANKPLGASGSYVQTIAFFRDRKNAEVWRVWYFIGIFVGALLATALQGGVDVRGGYERLTGLMPVPAVLLWLFVAGGIMGYGARMSGGCTSGHGMCGTAARSPASFAATGTFMFVAIALTHVLNLATRGAL